MELAEPLPVQSFTTKARRTEGHEGFEIVNGAQGGWFSVSSVPLR